MSIADPIDGRWRVYHHGAMSTVASVTFSRAAMETDEWVVELTVGHKAL
jgi:hypothetical protein